jgi:hypothetical protein
MRSGRILAEGRPEELTRHLNASTLETVFYHICVSNDKNQAIPGLEALETSNRYLVPNGF